MYVVLPEDDGLSKCISEHFGFLGFERRLYMFGCFVIYHFAIDAVGGGFVLPGCSGDT